MEPPATVSVRLSGFRQGWWCVWLACALFATGCSSHRFARRNAPEAASQLASQARAAADRGDSASAEYFLTAAVTTNPRDCEARLELSKLLEEHGSLEKATTHLRQLTKSNPEDPRSFARLARLLYVQNETAEAGEMVDRALELDPENSPAWMVRARLERDQHFDSRALAACYQVLATAPATSEARLLAAEIHFEQGHPQQASPLLRSLLEESTGCPRQRAAASWLLGRCYALDERWSDAASMLSAGIADRKASASDWYQVAYAHYRSGTLDEARQALDRALHLGPGDSEALALSLLIDKCAIQAAATDGTDALLEGTISQVSTARVVPAAAVPQGLW